MRLKSIRALNYLNLRTKVIEIPDDARLVLIAGPNGSGKTALLDGIRHALNGTLPRGIAYKKDLPKLITDGEKDGVFEVEAVDAEGHKADYRVSLKSGAASKEPPQGVVAPQAFMDLDAKGRRKALFQLYGVSLNTESVLGALERDGHAAVRLAKIKTALGGGFTAAAQRAKELSSEARGAWTATTGEAYGSSKAVDWRATVPDYGDVGDVAQLEKQLAAKKEAATAAIASLNELRSIERQHADAGSARATAEKLPQLEAAVRVIDEKIAEAQAKKEAATAAMGNASGGWTCPCPSCGVVLRSPKAGQLEEHHPSAVSPAQAGAQAQIADASLSTLRADRQKAVSAVENARAYKLMLERLPDRPTPEALQVAETDAADLLAEAEQVGQQLATAKEARDAAYNAVQATETAARYHADVDAYAKLAEAIDGLPAKYLSEALGQLNEQLEAVSAAYGRRVVMGEDMEPRYGTIPYPLASESQQWRIELALGLAFAAQSGAVVLMDRFDMVQLSDRGAILQMLIDQQAAQVVVAATLKAAPTIEAPGVYAHWLGELP